MSDETAEGTGQSRFSFDGYFGSDEGATISGVSSRFYVRYREARSALHAIRPFGIFDRQPASGFQRSVSTIESFDLGARSVGVFPIKIIEDRSDTERHIAVLAGRPQAKLLFARKHLAGLVDRIVQDPFRTISDTNILPFGGHRVVFYSYHLPISPQTPGAVNVHTGRSHRTGFELRQSQCRIADPAVLVHEAIRFEPDIVDALVSTGRRV